MIHLDEDRIADLALGATPAPGEGAHLETCAACTAELASLERTVASVRTSDETALVEPPTRVWDAVRAELHPPERSGSVTPLRSRRQPQAGSTRSTAWLLVAACALGVVLGIGAVVLAGWVGAGPDPSEVTVASAPLAPLDSSEQQGTASLVDGDSGLRLDLPAMELDPGDGYLEVWLINRDLTRMVSIGVIPTGSADTVLPVSQQLIDEGYVIVDVSREPFDDQPAHSGETLVRGELAI